MNELIKLLEQEIGKYLPKDEGKHGRTDFYSHGVAEGLHIAIRIIKHWKEQKCLRK